MSLTKLGKLLAIISSNIFSIAHSFSSLSGTPMTQILNLYYYPTCPWGYVHYFFQYFFSQSFRLNHFYWSINKFTDYFIYYLHFPIDPILWIFYFGYYISQFKFSIWLLFIYSISLLRLCIFLFISKGFSWRVESKIVPYEDPALTSHGHTTFTATWIMIFLWKLDDCYSLQQRIKGPHQDR